MNFSDETVMAYADNQLDAETRAALEAAMANDAELKRRVEAHLALAAHVRAAFDPVLDEPVPQHLLDAAAEVGQGSADIIDLTRRRKPRPHPMSSQWSWPQWGAIAASLIVGVMLGRYVTSDREPPTFATVNGEVVARGTLARALSTQLVSKQTETLPVRIGISFQTKSGEYCRTFRLDRGSAGMACKAGDNWQVRALAQSSAESGDAYRMAGSMPTSIMREVDASIEGAPLDAAAEQAALRRGWQR